ncbi:MAG: BamA/TamA family outer membrane protein, partial [Ignavibacteriales bacterium]|nr:BamA/TamA family outer membrane protein [Ignavibacteriales bacterium]
GLALSGGGARGFAQIGVLRALEERGVEFDLVVGSSVGAVVGGLYSLGYSVAELDSIARVVDWANALSLDVRPDRDELFVEQKVGEDRAVFTIRFRDWKAEIPSSINEGRKFATLLNLLVFQAPVAARGSFDELAFDYRAVATDLARGAPAVLREGKPSVAMRAGASVSFLLPPVALDTLVLVDGGLVANVPAKITREEGADVVLAVNATSPLHPRETLDAPWIVADQTVSIPMRLATQAQLEYADCVLDLDLEGYDATDFSDVGGVIERGYETALSDACAATTRIDSAREAVFADSTVFARNVTLAPFDDSDAGFGEERFDELRIGELRRRAHALHETGRYDSVWADLEGNVVRFFAAEKPIVRSVALEGATLIDADALRASLDRLVGAPYDGRRTYEALADMLRLYRAEGYSLADVDEVAFDEETGAFAARVVEGIVEEIRVSGAEHTNEPVITRELPFEVGDVFRVSELEEGLRNLSATNLFKSVVVSVERPNGGAVVEIAVAEKASVALKVGFKVSDENSPKLMLDLRDENFFGTGTQFGGVVLFAPRERLARLEHLSYRLFDTYLTYNVAAYYRRLDRHTYDFVETASRFSFDRERTGSYRHVYRVASAAVGRQFEKFGNVVVEASLADEETLNIEGATVDPYHKTIFAVRSSLKLDTQDRYPFPTSGARVSGYYETGQTTLGGEVSYSKLGVAYGGYYSPLSRHTFSLLGELGAADHTTPLGRQYELGGQFSFYGFKEQEFRGRQVARFSGAYRYFLPFPIFFDAYLKFRYDVGSIWRVTEQIKWRDLSHGVGAALALDTPVGPAEFAFGRAFTLDRPLWENPFTFGPVHFYFSIGYYY